jgi:hypothetical protein
LEPRRNTAGIVPQSVAQTGVQFSATEGFQKIRRKTSYL